MVKTGIMEWCKEEEFEKTVKACLCYHTMKLGKSPRFKTIVTTRNIDRS